MSRTRKYGILSLAIIGILSYYAKTDDRVDRYSRSMDKCAKISNSIAGSDASLRSSSSSTTCGPIATTLLPFAGTSFTADIAIAGLSKNSVILGAARYAAESEAGHLLDETGESHLNAAYTLIQNEIGFMETHEMNRLIIRLGRKTPPSQE